MTRLLRGEPVAQTGDAQVWLKDRGGLACQAKVTNVLGPVYLAVAGRYRGDNHAVARCVLAMKP